VASFQATAAEIARRRAGKTRPRVLQLEWLDPPFSSGHWNPELVDLAGGDEVIARAGTRSRRITWPQVAAADPEVVIVAPCGFTVERGETELASLFARDDWNGLTAVRTGRMILADGSAYFSSPSPRLEASLRIAAAAIDPERCGDLAPQAGWRPIGSVQSGR
jgi:iron complex transport system substrate-binding protein